ncbi:alkaline phosphatase [Parashewanella curva]|uniref:Alkaline phosphatase n=1 Tax=Parashewanella curva TaxID=2338552 RepID=A0A3L8Q1N0_9GAMM|nr:alkaline phosphatase [Parashewanella curva]RLV61380.1 alkaline phosphatase [Parashewanella curva]
MKIKSTLLALSLCLSFAAQADNAPKNIIFMIGDGMGPTYTTAYRFYKDDPATKDIETTVFDRILVGMSRTSPAKVDGYITDSAAAATAMATGVKTYNGAIGVDEHKHPVETLFEKAKAKGKATGVAVTSQVNHATPASFLAHNEYRRNYVEIAKAYLDSDADVILGGGQKYFSKDLVNQFKSKGYRYLDNINKLDSVKSGKVLGLFANVQLPWVVNEPKAHKLSQMTQKALELLSQDKKGFVLLVEGSLIDWAGHNNDIVTAMGEMDEFARSIKVAEQFVKQHPDTLLVVTADHSTGGLTVGANGKKAWHPEVLRNVKASPDRIASKLNTVKKWQPELTSLLGFEPNKHEWNALKKARAQGESEFTDEIKRIIDIRSNTGWTTGSHTAMDVQVFAFGKGYKKFIGSQDNTDLAKKLESFL